MNAPLTTFPLALAVGLALAGNAIAQNAPNAAQQQELDAARAALDQAAKRYGELARKYGGDAPIRIERSLLRRPVIGVLLAPDDKAGVRIAGVTPDSAAAAGGLRSGDRIIAIDDKPLAATAADARVDEARERLAAADVKTPVKLAFERDGKAQVVTLTPKVGDRLLALPRGSNADGDVKVFARDDGEIEIVANHMRLDADNAALHARIAEAKARAAAGDASRHAEWAAAIAPEVRTEVIRLGRDCKGEDCKLPMLAEAFRWNGLNLAAVDAQLGRYFGTNDGVLVLTTGKDLGELQPGDVIRTIAGKAVTTPREAMDALRSQPADGKVAVDYLRDRTRRTTQIAVPKPMSFTIPRMPVAPDVDGVPRVNTQRKLVFVNKDGKVQTWGGEDGKAPPAWIEDMPKEGTRIEKRKYVVIDKDGKRLEWEGDAGDTPPAWVRSLPQPPASPAPPTAD